CRAERDRVATNEMLQPLIALREHFGQQVDDGRRVVVDVSEERTPTKVGWICGDQCARCRLAMKQHGLVVDPRRRAEARRDRRAPSDRRAKRVDREDTQLRRMVDKMPSERTVTLECPAGECAGLR